MLTQRQMIMLTVCKPLFLGFIGNSDSIIKSTSI